MADIKTRAKEAAIAGLNFLVRTQNRDDMSADFGRFPFIFDCAAGVTTCGTTSWTTGTCVDALLAGYRFTGNADYLDAARRGVAYIKSLQYFCPLNPRVNGAMCENTPQSRGSHPRDGLTAAWGMLDWSQETGDTDAFERAKLFAAWFMTEAMAKGFPYWTAHWDREVWTPNTVGSFHSGSAFFFYRLHAVTGDDRYLAPMRTILDHYNTRHLDADGVITVILDRDTLEPLDNTERGAFAPRGWQIMHQYNDDFGALANLAGWKATGDASCRDGAVRFLKRMLATQRDDGGFGPAEWSVPSAAGPILTELHAAKALGIDLDAGAAVARAVDYLIGTQVRRENDRADGAFLGFSGPNTYDLSDHLANARTGAYAIAGLLRVAGAVDPYYFFEA
ncbi:MAG: hypothetical protein GX591_09800 [Planctomycetes bacterium]|nr:hypothetical protein [Planctomycetota bacterium]